MNDDIHDTSTILRTFIIQIKIHNMHQNGRDCHIRAVKLFGPCNSVLFPVDMNIPMPIPVSTTVAEPANSTEGNKSKRSHVFKMNTKLPYTNTIGVIR